MTVLTLPSAGLKPDKVPLVDAGERRPSPRADDPKLLECGGHDGPPVPSSSTCRVLLALRCVRLLVLLVLCALLVWLTRDAFCRAYDDTVSATGLLRADYGDDENNGYDNVNNSDGDDGKLPCKSYASYAAAEDDMLSAVPSAAVAPSDYDAGQASGMDDVYKKLEDFALNRALTGGRDVVSVLNGGDVEIGGGGVEASRRPKPHAAAAAVTKSARFIHDFSVNVTGIVDVEGRRCFVMPLVRDAVSPPASLFDLLFKMSSGYYSMDVTKVMADMRVVKPALEDLSAYGLYISKDCAGYSTYRLEKAVSVPATATASADV